MKMEQSFEKKAMLFLRSSRGQNFMAVLILLLFFLFSALSIRGKSQTVDEPSHYQYGMNILNGDSTRFDDSKMPFSAWNALPAKITESVLVPNGELKTYLSRLIVARLMTTLFSLSVGFMVFYWSRELYGFIPALVSLGLYVLDPNIIAHSQLVTTDLYITGMVLFSTYGLWKFANARQFLHGLMLAVALGVAQLAKYTAISLYPLFAVALLVHDWSFIKNRFVERDWQGVKDMLVACLKYLILAVIIGVLIINLGFLFNKTFTPLRDYTFRSTLFKSIQSQAAIVVPLPYPFLDGLDWIVEKERTNEGFGRIYLLGETRYGEGFPGYYFIAALLKVPIATQMLLVAAIMTYFFNSERRKNFLSNEWFLLWVVFFFTIYFNFFYRAQIGIRFYLMVFPLLYVFAGGLFVHWQNVGWKHKWAAYLAGLYLITSVVSYYPNYLSYFNEIVYDRKMAYQYLADSNLDWGQDEFALKSYLDSHSGVRRAPVRPGLTQETVRYYLSVNQLVGVTSDPINYQWLRENFEPVGTIAPGYLLFEITPGQMKDLCENTSYCNQK